MSRVQLICEVQLVSNELRNGKYNRVVFNKGYCNTRVWHDLIVNFEISIVLHTHFLKRKLVLVVQPRSETCRLD